MTGRRALQILWPAFLVAGVVEMLVFSAVDPGDLRWFGSAPIEASAQTVYTVAFLLFWGAIATAGAISALLATEADPPRDRPPG